MAVTIMNVSRGMWGYYASLPAANDAILAVPLESSGLEGTSTLQDYDTLSALLAGASNEQTTMARKVVTGVTYSLDDSGNKRVFDFDDVEWTSASGSGVGGLLICYDPDTTGGSDSDIIPMFFDDSFVNASPTGTVTYAVHASGLAEA